MPPTSDGWPGRAGRNNFGPKMRDERPVVDPQRGIEAANLNLAFWQAGGIGLNAPKAVFLYRPPGAPGIALLKYGAFTWDDVVYVDETSMPSYFGVAETPGVLTFSFPATLPGRPDADGLPTMNGFDILYARAQTHGLSGTKSSAEVTVLTPQSVEVRTYVGIPPVLTPDIAVAVELF